MWRLAWEANVECLLGIVSVHGPSWNLLRHTYLLADVRRLASIIRDLFCSMFISAMQFSEHGRAIRNANSWGLCSGSRWLLNSSLSKRGCYGFVGGQKSMWRWWCRSWVARLVAYPSCIYHLFLAWQDRPSTKRQSLHSTRINLSGFVVLIKAVFMIREWLATTDHAILRSTVSTLLNTNTVPGTVMVLEYAGTRQACQNVRSSSQQLSSTSSASCHTV